MKFFALLATASALRMAEVPAAHLGAECVQTAKFNVCHLVNSPDTPCACHVTATPTVEKCVKVYGGFGSSACFEDGSKPPKAC